MEFISSCKDCYQTTTGKNFLTVSYFSLVLPTKTEVFLNFASNCKQLYGLLPHQCRQGFFALVICSVTSIEANMLRLKMGLPGLRVP